MREAARPSSPANPYVTTSSCLPLPFKRTVAAILKGAARHGGQAPAPLCGDIWLPQAWARSATPRDRSAFAAGRGSAPTLPGPPSAQLGYLLNPRIPAAPRCAVRETRFAGGHPASVLARSTAADLPKELGFRQSFTFVRTPETSDLGMIEAYGVPPGVKRIPVSLAGLAPLETIGELGGPLRGGVFLAFASGGLGKQRGPGYLLTPGPHMQREGHQI